MSLNFEYEELKLMALYNTGSRERLMESLTEMRMAGTTPSTTVIFPQWTVVSWMRRS